MTVFVIISGGGIDQVRQRYLLPMLPSTANNDHDDDVASDHNPCCHLSTSNWTHILYEGVQGKGNQFLSPKDCRKRKVNNILCQKRNIMLHQNDIKCSNIAPCYFSSAIVSIMTVKKAMMNRAGMSQAETFCSAVDSDQDLNLNVRRDVTAQGRSCTMEHTVFHTKSAHVWNQGQMKLYL